jgi:hypothetical protein
MNKLFLFVTVLCFLFVAFEFQNLAEKKSSKKVTLCKQNAHNCGSNEGQLEQVVLMMYELIFSPKIVVAFFGWVVFVVITVFQSMSSLLHRLEDKATKIAIMQEKLMSCEAKSNDHVNAISSLQAEIHEVERSREG